MKQTLKYIYERLYEQLKYAETKHSISLTLATALAVFSATYLRSNSGFILVLSGSSIIFALISIFYSFIALFAKTVHVKDNGKDRHLTNLLFYKTIIKYERDDFLHELIKTYPFPKNYQPDAFDKDLASSIIATARVLNRKFQTFNYAITFLVFSIICQVIVVILMGV